MTTFDQLLAVHYRRVHRAALGFVHHEQEARELAHDALLKAHRARDRYDPSRPFYPWLYRILRNTCFDALARRKHREQSGLEPERVASTAPHGESTVQAAQERKQLATALETLSASHREIINMRHFQDLSYAEIGELLEIPEGTVMSRLYRARRALAAAMEA
jgi:RNA polymerase sigma-70 factor (ECF subfamily)